MTGSVLHSCASTDIRSVSRLLLLLVPASFLLAVGTWFGQLPHPDFNRGVVRDSPGTAATAAGSDWERFKGLPFAQRAAFQAGMQGLLAQLEQRHPAPAGNPRTAALHEAQRRMEVELDSLRLATAASWDSAKQEIGVAWLHLREACGEADEAAGP